LNKIKANFADLFNPRNRFIVMGRSAERIPKLYVSIPLVVVVIILGVVIGEILIFRFLLQNPQVPRLFRILYSFTVTIFFVVSLLCLWIVFYERRPIRTAGFKSPSPVRHYFKGFAIGTVMMLTTVGLMAATGHVKLLNSEVFQVNRILPTTVMLCAYVFQGANEEFLSRGWQLQVISLKSRPWVGAVVTSLIFALLHLGGAVNLLSIINLLLFSVLLVLFVLHDGSIWSACGWHTAWNWTMGSLLGLNVSGRKGVGVLIGLRTAGSDLVTGGKYGPEGSIMATVVLSAGILIFLYTRKGGGTVSDS
jgi:membrane protease YdiL (CAAX protease family)